MTEMYQQRDIFEAVDPFLCREHPRKCKISCKAQVFTLQIYLKELRLFFYTLDRWTRETQQRTQEIK